MADFIGLCAILIVALSPLLRRLYIDRFWVRERGTVIRLEVGIDNSEAAGAWAWFPVIEYDAAGQRFTSAISYWQRFNPKPEYLVGDKVEILYNPRNPSRFIINSWMEHIVLTGVVSIFIFAKIRER
jgi:hypothetical protein